ncbi:MAG: rhomboid family intramembrane serine protease [Lewinellaceae bacterium]|nr:rhomboid family intramembrane serine protease [Lewinellaceae bacterium]
MSITIFIIIATCLISMSAFNNSDVFYKMKHWPYVEARDKEYYRWLSSGFLHGDYMHLLFNMVALYFFGEGVEFWFQAIFPGFGRLLYVVFYLVSIVVVSAGTYYRHKDNPNFASIGASGAVSAVVFAAILLTPTMGIYMYFIPIPIPGFLFGIGYLWYSNYAAQRSGDSIDHLAHFYGAVFGFLFPLVLEPRLFLHFIAQMQGWFSSLGS